jgi:hypothetical protein
MFITFCFFLILSLSIILFFSCFSLHSHPFDLFFFFVDIVERVWAHIFWLVGRYVTGKLLTSPSLFMSSLSLFVFRSLLSIFFVFRSQFHVSSEIHRIKGLNRKRRLIGTMPKHSNLLMLSINNINKFECFGMEVI